MKEKTFNASLDQLHSMLQFVQEGCEEHKIVSQMMNKIILSLEEALVNIIYYAYPGRKGDVTIKYTFDIENQIATFLLIDSGIPFDPIEESKKIREWYPTHQDDHIGGYGIFLYLKVMDSVNYNYINQQNCLEMIKKI